VTTTRLVTRTSGCACDAALPAAMQASQTSKPSLHVSQECRFAHEMSDSQMLHVVAYAGMLGLCRCHRIIIELCLARRSVSNW